MTRKLPKRKPFFHLLIFSLIGIILVATAFFVVKGYVKRKWDGQSRFTAISFSDPVVVKSFDVSTRQGIVLRLPPDLQIESVGGRGKWATKVIAQAGTTDWAADSIADYLGISYTASESDLEWWDILMWAAKSRDISWQEVDLEKTSLVGKQTQPDGLEVVVLARNWDGKAREWFYDSVIASQALGVEVVNTTSVSGLGATAARIVESMGFKVRNLSSAAPPVQDCTVKSREEMKNNIATVKLVRVFNCKWTVGETEDLVLVLGRDYLHWKWGI